MQAWTYVEDQFITKYFVINTEYRINFMLV